jgi:glycosyltransferase involved in cell wall biosynthesis
LEVSDLVTFTGYIKQGAALIRQHRAYLHVALMENLPIFLIEAMAKGRPVFTPAVGGIPEVFDDGIEGRNIPLEDADFAAHLIVEWLDSDDLMKQASMFARNRYLHSFEETKIAHRLVNFMENQF